jgi:hypothetical protein
LEPPEALVRLLAQTRRLALALVNADEGGGDLDQLRLPFGPHFVIVDTDVELDARDTLL